VREGGEAGGFRATVGRCLDTDCEWVTGLTTEDFPAYVSFSRPAALGVAYTLTITWQPAVNAFVFVVSGGDGPVESHRITYRAADATPPRGYAYELRVTNRPWNCWITAMVRDPQRASIDVRFDNVRFNSDAVEATRAR
jgi:hypothetical protein